ncbi:MAG: helix-turn-helix transcriptional regulator [Tractidigestivibacter sp.]|jgi:DNA-binding CsgD family transcriptional regulator|uniref:helix-turn-helix transcriptional regulator n=1 Tax=Tractidigestivibacter sp. TaxID=2847320 RepID=UPI003D8BB7D6
MPSQAKWNKLNQFLLSCGAVHEPTAFCFSVLKNLPLIVHFDQGRCYLLDEHAEVYDMRLVGVDRESVELYLTHYSESDGARYSLTRRARERAAADRHAFGIDALSGSWVPQSHLSVMDWSKEPHDTAFYKNYVKPLGLTSSTGFPLYDITAHLRVLYCLDRTDPVGFSREEMSLLELASMHLGNLYCNFYARTPARQANIVSPSVGKSLSLTNRERQIAMLLLEGETPKGIAERLGISRETVYKHLSNIHEKLGVRSQVELIARLREEMEK